MSNRADTAGVAIRPPILFLGCLLSGVVVDKFVWAPEWPTVLADASSFFGWVLTATGLVLFVTATSNFRRAGTPIPTNLPTSKLVTSGVHGLSRNPIYVSLYLFYAGVAVLNQSTAALLLGLPLAFIMRHGVVAREEMYLQNKFGQDYVDYKSRVPRWL